MTTTPIPDQRESADAAAQGWALVQRAQAGDVEAFGEIYSRNLDTIFKFVYFRCGNRQLAEDITQETFLRAFRRIGSFTWQGRDLIAWLVTIARNLVSDHYKSGRYRFEIVTGDVLDADQDDLHSLPDDPLARAVASDSVRLLLQAMRELNDHQRTVLELRFLSGLSVAETAEKMGMTEGSVKALQYRAVRAAARNPLVAKLAQSAVAAA